VNFKSPGPRGGPGDPSRRIDPLSTLRVSTFPFPAADHAAGAVTTLLRSLGGEIETGREVRTLAEIGPARAVLFDLTPRQ